MERWFGDRQPKTWLIAAIINQLSTPAYFGFVGFVFWILILFFMSSFVTGSGQKMREKWLLEVFDEADSDGKGLLQEWKTIALMKKLNSQLCIRSLKQKIMEYNFGKEGEERSMINKNLFVTLFNETATRPDIYFILIRWVNLLLTNALWIKKQIKVTTW